MEPVRAAAILRFPIVLHCECRSRCHDVCHDALMVSATASNERRSAVSGTEGSIAVDKAALDRDTAEIKRIATELRGFVETFNAVGTAAESDAKTFTADGAVSPVYMPVIASLKAWAAALNAAITATCDSAENCADTAKATGYAMIGVDLKATDTVNRA